MTFFGIVGLFGLSLALGLGVIVAARHLNIGADLTKGVQRAHSHWVPRLGGIPIFFALAAWILLAAESIIPAKSGDQFLWVICLAPAFLVGLLEDLTHRIGPWPRLLTTMAGAALAFYLIDMKITRLGLPILDQWLALSPLLSLAITALIIGGGAHAINIIDGYNGLASSYALVVLFSVLIVADRVHDIELAYLSAGAIAATLGFFVLNFPRGRLFLGDSGAYLLGTIVGFLLAILVSRHSEVSPMFAAVLLVYPVWELLFSSYRRRVLRGTPAMRPDAIHLHTLVHKRLVRSHLAQDAPRRKILMNSATTLYMATLSTVTAWLALTFWTNAPALLTAFGLFIAAYLAIYFSLVRFRAQRQLSMKTVWLDSRIKLPKRSVGMAGIPGIQTRENQPVVNPLATEHDSASAAK